MKVLHVVPTYWPAVRYGGPIFSIHSLCRTLVQAGDEVEVFTTNVDGPGVLDVELEEPTDIDGVSVSYFPCRWSRRLYHSPELRNALQRRVRDFDLVHLHSVFLLPTLAAARRATNQGIPYICLLYTSPSPRDS